MFQLRPRNFRRCVLNLSTTQVSALTVSLPKSRPQLTQILVLTHGPSLTQFTQASILTVLVLTQPSIPNPSPYSQRTQTLVPTQIPGLSPQPQPTTPALNYSLQPRPSTTAYSPPSPHTQLTHIFVPHSQLTQIPIHTQSLSHPTLKDAC